MTQKELQITNGFCFDAKVRGAYPSYADCYFEENGIAIQKEPGDDEILKEGTVDYYTFSYYMRIVPKMPQKAQKRVET